MSLKINLGNWILDNPIIPASGTFGYGFDYLKVFDPNILGSFCLKGTTLKPRYGNPLPRIAEYANGMLNSVGLQNPGIDEVIKLFKELKKHYHKKVIANIAATNIEDFIEMIKKLNNQSIVGIYEINVSCPNIDKSNYFFDKNPKHLIELIKKIKPVAKKPIYIKLSPAVTDIVYMAKCAEQAGADGLVLTNTFPGIGIDVITKKPLMANVVGGVSGPGMKPIAMRAVYQCYKAVKIPIIASGGACNAYDVIEFMLAGARAVEIGSASLVDPNICEEIIKELPSVMRKLNIRSLKDIIGKAHG